MGQLYDSSYYDESYNSLKGKWSTNKRYILGKGHPTKTEEFLGKFQTAFDPPSFSENHIADFATKVRMFIMAGLLCII